MANKPYADSAIQAIWPGLVVAAASPDVLTVGAVDGILQSQSAADADYFLRICGRAFGRDEVERHRRPWVGRWEADTLVVDTVGFNDKFWFDRRGTPHTGQLHIVERYTRPNWGSLVNEVTLDDPVRTRYLVLWLTALPSVEGGFQGQVAEVVVRS